MPQPALVETHWDTASDGRLCAWVCANAPTGSAGPSCCWDGPTRCVPAQHCLPTIAHISCRRSRLALPKPPGQQEQLPQQAAQQLQQQQEQQPAAPVGAADFGFAQPPQQQQPGLPQHAPQRVQAQVQPQLLQRLRQVASAGPAATDGGLGAGTAEDPICLDEEVQEAEQGSGQAGQAGTVAAAAVVKAEADVEMGDAEQEAAGDDWGADDDGGCSTAMDQA